MVGFSLEPQQDAPVDNVLEMVLHQLNVFHSQNINVILADRYSGNSLFVQVKPRVEFSISLGDAGDVVIDSQIRFGAGFVSAIVDDAQKQITDMVWDDVQQYYPHIVDSVQKLFGGPLGGVEKAQIAL